MNVVVDAGALCEVLLARGFERPVHDVLAQHAGAVRAPELLDLEVISVVRRLLHRGQISDRVAEYAIAALRSSPIVRVPHRPLAHRVWQLRDRMTPYDAAYVALAERGGPDGDIATFVTTDARLGRAAEALGTVAVVVVPVA